MPLRMTSWNRLHHASWSVDVEIDLAMFSSCHPGAKDKLTAIPPRCIPDTVATSGFPKDRSPAKTPWNNLPECICRLENPSPSICICIFIPIHHHFLNGWYLIYWCCNRLSLTGKFRTCADSPAEVLPKWDSHQTYQTILFWNNKQIPKHIQTS